MDEVTNAYVQIIRYSSFSDQFMRISFPDHAYNSGTSSVPLHVIIHGGFWKAKYGLDNSAINELPDHFHKKNHAVCEIEYRRVPTTSTVDAPTSTSNFQLKSLHDINCPSGGWPLSHYDVLHALNTLASKIQFASRLINPREPQPLDLDNFLLSRININEISIIGHSAGGNLALWVCCQGLQRVLEDLSVELNQQPAHTHSNNIDEAESVCGTIPVEGLSFCPKVVVAIAPVADMIAAHERRLSDEGDAVFHYMNFQAPDPRFPAIEKHYRFASPAYLLPLTAPALLVTGSNDQDVPPELTRALYEKILSSHVDNIGGGEDRRPPVKYLELPLLDHYQVMVPREHRIGHPRDDDAVEGQESSFIVASISPWILIDQAISELLQ